jgi:hypothetical protein
LMSRDSDDASVEPGRAVKYRFRDTNSGSLTVIANERSDVVFAAGDLALGLFDCFAI